MKLLRHQLERRFWLRWHMFLILALTIASGFAVNVALHHLLDAGMASRYPLSVIASYGVFFMIVRAWLAYIRSRFHPEPATDHNGHEPDAAGINLKIPSKTASFALDSVDDPMGCLLGLGLVGVVSLAGWFWMALANAPLILTDVVFQFFLAAGLMRRVRRMIKDDWAGSLLRTTLLPFLAALVMAFGVGLFCQVVRPQASTLGEVIGVKPARDASPAEPPMAEKPEP